MEPDPIAFVKQLARNSPYALNGTDVGSVGLG